VMVNEKLATHYGIPGVTGTQVRRVPLPAGCPRGGFMTQASILKITANGTTTSPVPRGAFVIDRLLGEPPEPPPANVAAIEPDVRGATTIREQLAKHRDNSVCASCHRRIDPPGFALESFDVIGGFRDRYRSIGEGDPAGRGSIDPFIGISFKLGQPVDSSGELHDGRTFEDIQKYQSLLAADSRRLLSNLAKQFVVYATGRTVRFSDRVLLDDIVDRTQKRGGGLRTLLHELIGSPLFTGEARPIDEPERNQIPSIEDPTRQPQRVMMTTTLPPVPNPALRRASVLPDNPSPQEFQFDDEHTIELRVVGLFMPERVDAFRELMHEFPEVSLQTIDFDTAVATFQYAAASDLFRNAKSEQITERLNNRVRQLSTGLFSLKPLGLLPHEKLERIDLRIKGLDCKACSLAVHDILARVEGVEHATASFRDRLATAWIDPARTDRAALEADLKKRQVTLIEE